MADGGITVICTVRDCSPGRRSPPPFIRDKKSGPEGTEGFDKVFFQHSLFGVIVGLMCYKNRT